MYTRPLTRVLARQLTEQETALVSGGGLCWGPNMTYCGGGNQPSLIDDQERVEDGAPNEN